MADMVCRPSRERARSGHGPKRLVGMSGRVGLRGLMGVVVLEK